MNQFHPHIKSLGQAFSKACGVWGRAPKDKTKKTMPKRSGDRNMLLHIGAGKLVCDRDIIGCFDIDGKTVSEIMVKFLQNEERNGRTVSAGSDLPRSFVLCDGETVLTHISTQAILNRSSKNVKNIEME